MAEFTAVRAEIGYRSTTQHLLMNLNIVATGAIVGFAIRDPEDNGLLLLLVAIVSSALGLLWADHARSVALLAGYTNEKMRFDLDGESVPLFPWEEYSGAEVEKQRLYLQFPVAVILVFVLPPALALTFLQTENYLDSGLRDAAWWTGLVLSSYMCFVIAQTELKPVPPEDRRRWLRVLSRGMPRS